MRRACACVSCVRGATTPVCRGLVYVTFFDRPTVYLLLATGECCRPVALWLSGRTDCMLYVLASLHSG